MEKTQFDNGTLDGPVIADDSVSRGLDMQQQQSGLPVGQSKADTSSSNKTGDDRKTGHAALDRRFNLSWLQSRRTSDSPAITIGPLGLRPLHISAEPLIHLIFVHGLRGGSIKTWRKGNDPELFWPQTWLPLDPDFQNANVFSFGYNADYSDTKDSILNVQDFGRALLGEMRTSPHLRRNKSDPIILIGHSMGGLVLKMAYTLARQDVRNPEIGQRVRCLFFLATPHRGSDFAALLNNILRATGVLSARPYVADLERNSASAKKINKDFEMYAQDVSLWSFYETLKTSLGVTSTIIVDRDSAILGYEHENVQYLNGNHRGICKYSDPEDSNYIAVKNALATAINSILGGVNVSKDDNHRVQMKLLRGYLDVSDQPENDFANQQEIKATGTCRWLEERESFRVWRDAFEDCLVVQHNHIPQFYWLSARPGTGKSVLAGHAIAHLQKFHLDCAYYFFHHGEGSGQVLSGLLRSLAYQMALLHVEVRGKLIQLKDDGVILDHDDERSIWRKVFLNIILQTNVYRPQYWVIDALDECIRYPGFFTLLNNLEVAFPLRILITSRIVPEIQVHFNHFGANVISTEIHLEDSMKDIEAHIQTQIEFAPFDNDHERQDLAGQILSKSNGSFLWVHLVLHELSTVYTEKSILTVLDDIPEGMVPFYERTMDRMSRNTREKEVAKAILLWAIHSVRPLHISELQEALRLDIGANVPSIKKTVEGLCGQMIYVDKNDRVQIVHPTAREFLVGDSTSAFAIAKQKGHERLAMSCFRYLSGNEMKPPRNRRFLNASRVEPSRFSDYACTAFAEHVSSASSGEETLLTALDSFLKTNVLSWIEHLAQKGRLYYLGRTTKNLKGYLERRAQQLSLSAIEVERVNCWVMDLTRLVTMFGVAITICPSSIYFLVPPLCPTTSAIFKQFGKSPDGLVLAGIENVTWKDCISRIDFNNSATSLASGDKAFAVGMETGDIEIYNHGSCQWERTIQHHEPLDVLQFDTSGDFLASCGVSSIKLWSISGTELWTHTLKSRILELAFGTNSLVGVSMNGQVTTRDLKSGHIRGDLHTYPYKSPDEEPGRARERAPHTASLSLDSQMIALGYRAPDIGLWGLQDHEFVGWCMCPGASTTSMVLFNPNPGIDLIAAVYTDGTLAVFDFWQQELIKSVRVGGGSQGVSSLASSPDGRTLVTVDYSGTMQVWDFETLALLYHVKISYYGLRLVAFGSSGSRIIDLTHSKLRVWELAVLFRRSNEEDVNVSTSAVLPVVEGRGAPESNSVMTVMVCHPTIPVVLLGKYNGSVATYSSRTGKEDAILYSHSKCDFITAIAVSSQHILASGDVLGDVQVWQLEKTTKGTLKTSALILKTSVGRAVTQLLITSAGDFVLISTAVSDSVFSTRDGSCIGKLTFSPVERTSWRWVSKASSRPELLLIIADKLKRYSWENFPSLLSHQVVTLPSDSRHLRMQPSIRTAVLDADGQNLVIDFHYMNGIVTADTILILSVGAIFSAAQPTEPMVLVPNLIHVDLSEHVKYFLGLSGNRLLFIDSTSWVSSVDVNAGINDEIANEYTRHFFVPNEFVDQDSRLLPVLTPEKDFVFATQGELAVVRNGLKFQAVARLSDEQQKWSSNPGLSNEDINDS